MAFRISVSDLLSRPGHARTVADSTPISIDLPNASVDGEAAVEVRLRSLTDGVVARGSVSATAHLVCNRCLTEWSASVEAPFEQVFRLHPDDEEDELPVEQGGWIDLGEPIHDELALALPTAPLCREDCAGLCPTCGTDLNTDPCGGHGDEFDSPFASLRQLFEG